MNVVFWKYLKKNLNLAKLIYKKFKTGKLVSLILSARFQNVQEIKNYLTIKELQSPFTMLNMQKAVTRLKKAVHNSEKIAIYGDYDCDGICASAMLFYYLKSLNADVCCHIPTRDEGYGLNKQVIKKFKQENINLIITVDNGIKAIEEAKLIKKLKMDLIVTDHHNIANETPDAFTILNPKLDHNSSNFKELCGAGVVLKLIAAMESGNFEFAFEFAGDLAAIATVADLVPLIDENKTIVLKGLHSIKLTKNLGLKELINLSFKNQNFNLNSTDLAFKICPALNAAGRIKTANLAFELLTCKDIKIAKQKAKQVIELNLTRKQLQLQLFKRVDKFIKQNLIYLKLPILIVYGNNWNKGLIGLVAGNLVLKFKKPTIVLSINNDVATGSARSFESFNMFEALKFCSDLFLKWGGHNLAGGLTITTKNIKKFIYKINEFAKTQTFAFIQKIDLTTELTNLNINEIKQFKILEPFGKFNEPPILALKNLTLTKIKSLKNGCHLNLTFKTNKNQNLNVLAFNKELNKFYFSIGEQFNILIQVEINNYFQTKNLSFKLIDLRPAKFNQKDLTTSFKLLKQYLTNTNDKFQQIQYYKPTRNDFKLVFLKLKQIKCFYGNLFDFFYLVCDNITYLKFKIVIQTLIELKIIIFNGISLKINTSSNKINLNDSILLKNLFHKT